MLLLVQCEPYLHYRYAWEVSKQINAMPCFNKFVPTKIYITCTNQQGYILRRPDNFLYVLVQVQLNGFQKSALL